MNESGDTLLEIRVKRIYQPPEPIDGYRILVDRLWPRGMSRDRASIDEWMKDIAPSNELRRWFGHDSSRWNGFKQRYATELVARKDLVQHILCLARRGQVTLVYSAKDIDHNQAVALLEFLAVESKEQDP